jgi:hypothetical protein
VSVAAARVLRGVGVAAVRAGGDQLGVGSARRGEGWWKHAVEDGARSPTHGSLGRRAANHLASGRSLQADDHSRVPAEHSSRASTRVGPPPASRARGRRTLNISAERGPDAAGDYRSAIGADGPGPSTPRRARGTRTRLDSGQEVPTREAADLPDTLASSGRETATVLGSTPGVVHTERHPQPGPRGRIDARKTRRRAGAGLVPSALSEARRHLDETARSAIDICCAGTRSEGPSPSARHRRTSGCVVACPGPSGDMARLGTVVWFRHRCTAVTAGMIADRSLHK